MDGTMAVEPFFNLPFFRLICQVFPDVSHKEARSVSTLSWQWKAYRSPQGTSKKAVATITFILTKDNSTR
jgi:hypothetical protein